MIHANTLVMVALNEMHIVMGFVKNIKNLKEIDLEHQEIHGTLGEN